MGSSARGGINKTKGKGKEVRGDTVKTAASGKPKQTISKYPGFNKKAIVGSTGQKASGSVKGQKSAAKSTGYKFPGKTGSSKTAAGRGGGGGKSSQNPHMGKPIKT